MSNIWHDEITPVFIYNMKISDLVAVIVWPFSKVPWYCSLVTNMRTIQHCPRWMIKIHKMVDRSSRWKPCAFRICVVIARMFKWDGDYIVTCWPPSCQFWHTYTYTPTYTHHGYPWNVLVSFLMYLWFFPHEHVDPYSKGLQNKWFGNIWPIPLLLLISWLIQTNPNRLIHENL